MASASSTPPLAEPLRTLHDRFVELAEITGGRAPILGPPASAADLARVEHHLGTLPAIASDLLRIANGWIDVPMSDPPVTWYSCEQLVAPARAAFVAKARAARGFARDPAMQRGFVLGGNPGTVVLLSPTSDIILYDLAPRAQGMSGPPTRFFALWIQHVERRLATERAARSRPARTPLAAVDEAIAAFNHPAEVGEDVHDSVESVRAIVAELAASPFAVPLRLLLAELERGYAEPMRFVRARRREQVVEVQRAGRWVRVDRPSKI